ncbi:MAG: DNA-3-methyladenine glycosylase family protein [Chitinophagales bacterium]
MNEHGEVKLVQEKNICLYLCYSIMSQQLSTKVADVFHKRFLDLFGGKEPTAQQVANTKFETLRAIGLSNAKANYVLNVANFELNNGMQVKKLQKMSDDDIITYLTQIKGVGRWTVEMILMFALAREDHFAAGDLGLQTAMIKLYKLDNSDKKKFHQDMLRISKRWSPYRTYASMYLWRYKDKK